MTQPKSNHAVPQTDQVDVSIVIVNWNSVDFVRQCLRSLQRNSPALSYEVIVVDSGSFDGCGEMLKREFPSARFFQSHENVGFAKANNLGARHSRGRLLLFLNPDTEIIGDALDKMAAALNRSADAGLAGARLLNSDGSLQTSCIQSFPTILNQLLDSEWLRRAFPRSRLWGMSALYQQSPLPARVEIVSGACLLIKRYVYQQLHGFDENFFMYSEDLDLCRRTTQSGYDCIYVPEASVVHHGGGSSNSARSMFSVLMMRESVCRLLRIHRGPLAARTYCAASGVSALLRIPAILLAMTGQQIRHGRMNAKPLRKWMAILRWSLGLESWTRKESGDNSGSSGRPDAVALPSPPESKRSCVA